MVYFNEKIVKVSQVIGRVYYYDDINKLINNWNNIKPIFLDINKDTQLFENFIEFLYKNRILEIVKSNCMLLKDDELDNVISRVERKILEKRKNVNIDNLKNIPVLLGNQNIMLIKGSALSRLYPDNATRYQVDADVILKSIDELWEILKLTSNDYTFDRLKLYTSFDRNLSASLDLEPKDSKKLPIDIHISPYEIWGSINYDIDLWKNAKQLDNGCYVPSYEDTLLMLVGHLATQWIYRIRDINDCYIILKNCELDWKYIYDVGKKYNLLCLLNILLHKVKEIYGIDCFRKLYKDTDYTIKWYEKIFMEKNLGIPNVYTSWMLQFSFVYKNYKEKHNIIKSIYETLRNTKNLIIYENRAYKINNKLKIKKFNENEIIVLTPNNVQNILQDVKSEKVIFGTTLKVINQGKKNEYFSTPYGTWTQSTYYVNNQ